jgi:hypothetical protein
VADVRISFASKEYVRVPVKAKEAGVVVDPTNPLLTVQMAFTDGSDPSAWTTAAWETDATTEPDTFFARVLVGGTGSGAAIELARGTYTGWVKITATPEVPVLRIENLLEVA